MTKRVEPGQADIDWRESLARSKAQVALGERIALLPILDRLRLSAESLEAEQGLTSDGEKLTIGR